MKYILWSNTETICMRKTIYFVLVMPDIRDCSRSIFIPRYREIEKTLDSVFCPLCKGCAISIIMSPNQIERASLCGAEPLGGQWWFPGGVPPHISPLHGRHAQTALRPWWRCTRRTCAGARAYSASEKKPNSSSASGDQRETLYLVDSLFQTFLVSSFYFFVFSMREFQ